MTLPRASTVSLINSTARTKLCTQPSGAAAGVRKFPNQVHVRPFQGSPSIYNCAVRSERGQEIARRLEALGGDYEKDIVSAFCWLTRPAWPLRQAQGQLTTTTTHHDNRRATATGKLSTHSAKPRPPAAAPLCADGGVVQVAIQTGRSDANDQSGGARALRQRRRSTVHDPERSGQTEGHRPLRLELLSVRCSSRVERRALGVER